MSWLPAPGFPGYSISSEGQARNDKTGRILRQQLSRGYCVIKPMDRDLNKGISTRIHRLVGQAFIPNPEGLPCIDHINGNRQDNRVENLRWTPYTGNARNRGLMKNNTSGHPGVYFHKPSKKWMAYFREDGKMYYLGLFSDFEEATMIRDSFAADAYGDYFRETKCPEAV